MLYAITTRHGALPERWTAKQAKAMYAHGVALAAGHAYLQVWRALDNGDLLQYDGERTRKLTDKIIAARNNGRP